MALNLNNPRSNRNSNIGVVSLPSTRQKSRCYGIASSAERKDVTGRWQDAEIKANQRSDPLITIEYQDVR
ncbi:hypothetical protein ACT691_06825 [Vibrio metschnikovii]